MNKKGFSIWGFLIAMIIFLAIGWFITNNLYVTYNSINLDKKDYDIKNLYLCKNNSEHQKLHASLNKIINQLVCKGIVKFKNGEYYL